MESPAAATLDSTELPWSNRKSVQTLSPACSQLSLIYSMYYREPLLRPVLDEDPDVIGFQEPRLEAQRDDIINGLKDPYDCTSHHIWERGEVSRNGTAMK